MNASNSISNSRSVSRLSSMEILSKGRIGKIKRELGHLNSDSIESQEMEFDYFSSDSDSTDLTTEESSVIGGSTLTLYNNLFTFSKDETQEVVKKIKRRKHRGKLLLKLTQSEMELLGDKTGVFNGVNDKYRRFLSGDAKLKKIHEPAPWEFVVGLPPSSAKRGKSELEMRLTTRADLKKKSQALEELRILYL